MKIYYSPLTVRAVIAAPRRHAVAPALCEQRMRCVAIVIVAGSAILALSAKQTFIIN